MKKLLLLTSILTIIFASFGFAKTYSIKKEKEGKWVRLSPASVEVILTKGKVFQSNGSETLFSNIMIYDKKVFYCNTLISYEMSSGGTANTGVSYCHTWVTEGSQ